MKHFLAIVLALLLVFTVGCGDTHHTVMHPAESLTSSESNTLTVLLDDATEEIPYPSEFSIDMVPDYTKNPSVEINDGIPFFDGIEDSTISFESYSALDELGRCGPAFANLGTDLMPTEERGNISSVHPTGWHSDKYDFINQENLYNRCHLIKYALTGENANARNLITGTRYMNTIGMLPYEDLVQEYVETTGNHVLYRVTPIFEGDNLLASGVLMEARSVEDGGEELTLCVYCYNVQPGIHIDYATGDNYKIETESDGTPITYVLNNSSMKFHLPTCEAVYSMSEKNKQEVTCTREELLAQGYAPCGGCNP